MTLPPERITIKRRREDEPVEALFIEQKRHCSSSTYWVRVRDGKPFDTSAIPSPRGYPDSVMRSNNHAEAPSPKLQKTFPTKDATLKPRSPSPSMQIIHNAQGATRNESLPTRPVPPNQGRTAHDKKSSKTLPRTFHFSNSSKLSTAQSMLSIHGIRKSRSARPDLAVFEEKIKTARDPRDLDAGFRKSPGPSGRGIGTPWAQEGIHANSDAQPAASVGGDLSGCQKKRISGAPLQAQIKFQPKPATALREEKRPMTTASEDLPDAQDGESQDEYVYDTYLRTKQPLVGFQSDGPMDIDQLEIATDGKVGVLVIAEEDEAAWEAYGDEEESDKDWNSEEEDENAEDFYGNDYPEDEIDSEDEYGRGAYRYRNNASDDEEFDQEWSDEEDGVSFYGRRRGAINGNLYE